MTTIVWDGKTLAVDSQVSLNGSVSGQMCKLYVDGDMAFAMSGELQDHEAVFEYLKNPAGEPPAVSPDGLSAFFVDKGVAHACDDRLRLRRVRGKEACGSGWQWAQAAMDFGANAIEAVRYASKRDVYTGGRVRSYTYDLG